MFSQAPKYIRLSAILRLWKRMLRFFIVSIRGNKRLKEEVELPTRCSDVRKSWDDHQF